MKTKVPVQVALASQNVVLLPEDSDDLSTYRPRSIDLFRDLSHSHVYAGFVYEYDIQANIKLIKKSILLPGISYLSPITPMVVLLFKLM